MNKKKVKLVLWLLNFIVIFLLVWSLINYTILNNEVSKFMQIGGIFAMILLIIFLEGAPVFVGPSVAFASILIMEVFPPGLVLFLFLVSAVIGNIFYFYLGYFFGRKILRYFDKKDIHRYKKLFKKYGRASMLVMAVSPIPYLPTIAGIFGKPTLYLAAETLIVRLIRHTVVFFFWYFVILGLG